MPKMNGFDTTRRIMETHPTPIIIVSGTLDVAETASVFRAIEAGALAVLPRLLVLAIRNMNRVLRNLCRP